MAPSDQLSSKRCFVSGNDSALTAKLVTMLRDLGAEAVDPGEIALGQSITKEINRLIAESDFIAVVMAKGSQALVAYELGMAQGLGKPALVVFEGDRSFEPANAYTVSIPQHGDFESIRADVDLFVRNARNRSAESDPPKVEIGQSLDWARERLVLLRQDPGTHRPFAFERLCVDIFRAANAEVVPVGRNGRDDGADFVVWFNDIAFELGGPTLVECKFYGGRAGSILKNSEHAVRRIEETMNRSDAKLALLVYDHDHSYPPPSLYETPRVLSFAIEDVIDALELRNLEKSILRRRERALISRHAP